VLCRQRRGGGGGGGGGGGTGKKKTMQRKTGDDYDPYERIEVSVTDNIMWTWNWLMKHESMVGSDGHRPDMSRTPAGHESDTQAHRTASFTSSHCRP